MEHNVAYIGMYSLVHEAIHIFYYTGIGANVEYFLLSCMHQPIQPKSLADGKRWAIHLYSNTPPHVEAPSGLRRGIGASSNYFI